MQEVRTVIRGSTLRVVGLAAHTLVGFFLMPFLVHSLGDRYYGYWALVATILGYYGLLDLGIVSAVQFHVAKALGEKNVAAANRAISTAFFSFAALGMVILLLTIAIASVAHRLIADPADLVAFRRVLLIMGVGFAIGFPGRAFVGALSAHLRWDLIASIGMVVLFVRAAAIVLLIKLGWGIVSLAAVTVLADAVTFGLYFWVLSGIEDQFHLSFSAAKISALKEVLHYSVYSLIIKVNDQLRFYIDVLVVSGIVGVSAVTHYSIASRLALSFRDLLIAILGILAPWFSVLLGNADFSKMRRLLTFGTKLSVSISMLTAMCLTLYGRRFIEAWMGKNYLDAYWPLVLLAWSVFFVGVQYPSSSYLYGVFKHRFLAYAGLIEAGINAVLSICLARVYGLVGVALGTIIPAIAMWLVVEPIYACRQAAIPLKTYYISFYGRAAAVVMAAVLGPWLLIFKYLPRPTLIHIGAHLFCQIVIATAAAYLLVLEKGERASIARALFSRVKPKETVEVPPPEKATA